MRGYPLYNFPAFDEAEQRCREAGHNPVSPASLDRAFGFNEETDEETPELMGHFFWRDCAAIYACDAVALLPGWEASRGARMEKAIAEFLSLPVLDSANWSPMESEVA